MFINTFKQQTNALTKHLVFVLLLLIFPSGSYAGDMIKEPNVAGQFYQGNAALLSKHVEEMLAQADIKPSDRKIKVLIVPHAGHIYSGPVASWGFKAASKNQYRTVVLLGPTHYYRFDGVAIWPKGGFKTPLGVVEIDEDFAQKLMERTGKIKPNGQVFERDHVLEVELPFLQKTFKDFKIVPMIMDREADMATLQEVAGAISDTAGERDDVLFLVSSDLSHFHDAVTAHAIDSRGIKAVEEMDIEKLWKDHYAGSMEIDGFKEVITALLYAKQEGLDTVKVLKYGHSGDVTGDVDRVVGYTSIIIYKE